MSLDEWYRRIQLDIEAWRKYRNINDEQESEIRSIERWLDVLKKVTPLQLRYQVQSDYYLRLAKSAERNSYVKNRNNLDTLRFQDFNIKGFGKFDKPYLRELSPFLTKFRLIQVNPNRLYTRTDITRYHIDTTGFDFTVKYAKRDILVYEPKLTSYELERTYVNVTVRKMRKQWGGISRVFDDELPPKAIYGERYAHRDLNRLGRQMVTKIDKSRIKEQTLRSISHTLIPSCVTPIQSVEMATATGLKTQYEKAVRKEIERQTSKSSATVDAWSEFGNADTSSMPDGIDWTDLKAVLRKFATIVQDTKNFIADAWEEYREEALKERLASPYSKGKIMSADDINELVDADKSYMDPNY